MYWHLRKYSHRFAKYLFVYNGIGTRTTKAFGVKAKGLVTRVGFVCQGIDLNRRHILHCTDPAPLPNL
jgi:hypothetical protein